MKIRKNLRTLLNTVGKFKMYFLRGHNSWFYFIFWLVNFTIIIYKLLLEDLFMPEWMRFSYFFLLFCFIYVPLAILIGRFDFKRGTFRGEMDVTLDVNPIVQKQFKNQETIILEQKELREELKELRKIMEKMKEK